MIINQVSIGLTSPSTSTSTKALERRKAINKKKHIYFHQPCLLLYTQVHCRPPFYNIKSYCITWFIIYTSISRIIISMENFQVCDILIFNVLRNPQLCITERNCLPGKYTMRVTAICAVSQLVNTRTENFILTMKKLRLFSSEGKLRPVDRSDGS